VTFYQDVNEGAQYKMIVRSAGWDKKRNKHVLVKEGIAQQPC
jgi:hypothetical protein